MAEYIQGSNLKFEVTRPYVISEIKTSIHLPDGRLASSVLDGNSAVIYRIDFAKDRNLKETDEIEREKTKLLNKEI